jgi:hypothetical protein
MVPVVAKVRKAAKNHERVTVAFLLIPFSTVMQL